MSRNSYDGGWLKGRGLVDKLSSGEVAEWLNAAVSKTVTSVIPASGVRIPPSPRFEHAPASPSLSARRLASPDALSARSALRAPLLSTPPGGAKGGVLRSEGPWARSVLTSPLEQGTC